MKTDTISSRIKKGNDIADIVAKYLNIRFGYEFEKVSLEEDKRDMIDFRCLKTGKTAQFKCRENKSDIIFEARRFYIDQNSFNMINGRDCRTKSNIYVCLSSNKKTIIVAQSDLIKSIAEKEISKIDLDSKNIMSLIKETYEKRNKTFKLTDSKNKIQSWFKVDEGVDTEEYYKILVFIPFDSINNAVKIDLENGEDLFKQETWKKNDTQYTDKHRGAIRQNNDIED